MLIGSNAQYEKVAFSNEGEIEEVVIGNAQLLFGQYAVYLPQMRISTLGGKGTVPDAVVIDLDSKQWYVVEVERGIHGTWDHIAPQVSRQLTAISKPATRAAILQLAIDQLRSDPDRLASIVDELGIKQLDIHKTLEAILGKNPVVAIPIDEIPSDLNEWTTTLKHEVRIWKISKYSRVDGDEILYHFPEGETEAVVPSVDDGGGRPTITPSSPADFSRLLKAGQLHIGETLWMEYGPRGRAKQRFTAIVRDAGLEVDGMVLAPSTAAVKCIRKAGSDRPTANGWIMWRNSEGLLIDELYKRILSIGG